MGLRELYPAWRPPHLVHVAFNSAEEKKRRADAAQRMNLYRDNAEPVVRNEMVRLFRNREQQARMTVYARYGCANALYKRTVDDVAGPVYSTSPVRTVVDNQKETDRYRLLANECELDANFDLCTKFMTGLNVGFMLWRIDPELGLLCDVIGPDNATIIPHPRDVKRIAGFAYSVERFVAVNGDVKRERIICAVDDKETFQINANGALLAQPESHTWGFIPVVAMHKNQRSGEIIDATTGNDLLYACLGLGLSGANMQRLLTTRGHRQLTASAEIKGLNDNMPLDPETVMVTPVGTQAQVLDTAFDPEGFIKADEHRTKTTAANWGFSLDRINQKSQVADEAGLMERRAALIRMAGKAEQEAFKIIRTLSASHPNPEMRMDESTELKLEVDFPEVARRMDRKTQLEIRDMERRDGSRNRLDGIKEDHPEIRTDDEAWNEFLRNKWIESIAVVIDRALEMPANGTPGQDPARNGAMGPAARDGTSPAPQPAVSGGSLRQLANLKGVLETLRKGGPTLDALAKMGGDQSPDQDQPPPAKQRVASASPSRDDVRASVKRLRAA